MELVRRIGAIILVMAAIGVWFGMAPEEPKPAKSYGAAISETLSAHDANEALADSAPQQQVVNGWTAKDLLAIVAREQDAALQQTQPVDHRVPAELALAVVGIALGLLTTQRKARSVSGQTTSSPNGWTSTEDSIPAPQTS